LLAGSWIYDQDGTSFSLHDTHVAPNTQTNIHYANHIEACLIYSGSCTVTDKQTGEAHALGAGEAYLLDQHDRHSVTAGPDGCKLVCVFTPPCDGREVHNEKGIYPVITEKGVYYERADALQAEIDMLEALVKDKKEELLRIKGA